MRKPTICICENKDADQLRGNREADQRLCFRYTDSTIPLLAKSEISKSLVIFCACTARFVSDLLENHIVGFPTRWLISCSPSVKLSILHIGWYPIFLFYLFYLYLLHMTSLIGFFPDSTRLLAGDTLRVEPRHRTRSACAALLTALLRTGSSR